MPKFTNTRKLRADELLKRLKNGPSFYVHPSLDIIFNVDEATRQYRLWATSWILDELIDLVPELKHLKESEK